MCILYVGYLYKCELPATQIHVLDLYIVMWLIAGVVGVILPFPRLATFSKFKSTVI